MNSVLLIQTAFLGDAILSTSLLEVIAQANPQVQIYVLTRRGHEDLFKFHPRVKKVFIWNKQGRFKKYLNLLKLIFALRSLGAMDVVINLQRFFSTGFIVACMRSRIKVGYTQNPLSWFYTHKLPFEIQSSHIDGTPVHEVQRNFNLWRLIQTDMPLRAAKSLRPKIYFGNQHLDAPADELAKHHILLAPASVWKTKEWPEEKWAEFILRLKSMRQFQDDIIYLIGAKDDVSKAKRIQVAVEQALPNSNIQILAGKQNIMQTMLLMKKAKLVVANDSAPIHMASAMNAPTLAIFCSTLPEFGFYPLAKISTVWEYGKLPCRPCGIHGKSDCPLKHFNCAPAIPTVQFIDNLIS
jgi:ADP-heptose:LPS heptosyltransferase